MITTNNLSGVFTRLVAEGRVDAFMPPNVDAISYAIQEQAARLPPKNFLAWLETLLDVPIDSHKVYASELTALRQSTGKSPARLLTDQIRNAMPGNAGTRMWGDHSEGDREGRPYVTWIVLGLALIGLLCVLRHLARFLKNATQ